MFTSTCFLPSSKQKLKPKKKVATVLEKVGVIFYKLSITLGIKYWAYSMPYVYYYLFNELEYKSVPIPIATNIDCD